MVWITFYTSRIIFKGTLCNTESGNWKGVGKDWIQLKQLRTKHLQTHPSRKGLLTIWSGKSVSLVG